jgi:Uma2 family endonuclease
MGTTTKISFEEFQKLQDAAEGSTRYELDEGKLVVTPSPAPHHNIVRYRLRRALTDFVQAHRLGLVLDETDFRLSPDTVRKPDIAFLTKERLRDFDPHRTPVPGSPDLAVEVISPGNLAQDTLKKVRQYLAGGSQAVWLVYPNLRLIETHDVAGIRVIAEPESLVEVRLFPNQSFGVSLVELFSENPVA